NAGEVRIQVGSGFERAKGLLIQADGKIVVTGLTSFDDTYIAVNQFTMIRFDANGNLDPDFGDAGIVRTPAGYAETALMQPDGSIVLAGYSSPSPTLRLARYLNDGTPADVPPGGGGAPHSFAAGSSTPTSGKLIAYGADAGGGPRVIVVDAQTG